MHSLEIDKDKDAREFKLDSVDVFTDEVGTLLKFQMDAAGQGLPEFAEAWVCIRDAAGGFVKGREPFVDDEGEFLATTEIVNGKWAVYLPTGAICHPAEGVYNVCSIVVCEDPEDEEYGLAAGVVNHKVMLPAPREWDVIEWLRPLIDLVGMMARVSGLQSPEEFAILAANFVDWFEYEDMIELDRLAEALAGPDADVTLEAAANAIFLRAPELMPENVVSALLSLFDIPLGKIDTLEGSAREEAAFVKKVAAVYGIKGRQWKELVDTFNELSTSGD